MNTAQNTTKDYHLYIFRLLYVIFRPIRKKYDLSVNCILILNSCYLYAKLVKNQFYMTDIYKFTSYYSIPVMKNFFRVLTLRGLIIPINPGEFRVLYNISEQGIKIIQEIEESYNKELYNFTNKYNIDL